jgi:hypothetical protein
MTFKQSLVNELLLSKAVAPLSASDNLELDRIQNLDVIKFTEVDVREEIINPILCILGYQKGKYSSVDREKHISFADKTGKYIDYNLTLWEKNFWLIEAKRPIAKENFGYAELSQAIEYAVHPEIDAVLVVLCDGKKIAVYDREEDLVNPIIQISVTQISQEFGSLSKLLSPINAWFFYKRRVLRVIDRAFEHEVNQNRVVEFQNIVTKRLNEKRTQILDNFRSLKLSSLDEYGIQLAKAPIDEIGDIHFFISQSQHHINLMMSNLIDLTKNSSIFPVLYKIFPDEPRDANDFYHMHSLSLLLSMEKENLKSNWLPAWLVDQATDCTIHAAIKRLIELCLNNFQKDAARQTVLLAANTYRRIFKSLAVLLPNQKRSAEIQHLMVRYSVPEFTWQQIISSPEGNMIHGWEQLTNQATFNFTRKHKTENHKFNIELAKQELRQLWVFEQALLANADNYQSLLSENNFGELHPTEANSVVYDNLGHCCLCILEMFPEWRAYILSEHNDALVTLARMGSWAARKMLNPSNDMDYTPLTTQELADRFFYGDLNVLNQLVKSYQLK